ncbi:hypothetical protein [Thaumasiovibrio sp. DFM-14]|uniref:hypothetical protein n=1 Tax=Thaumasiovibrio sp. DFM-14 TaxID=3384792 RepID=UPI00399F8B27
MGYKYNYIKNGCLITGQVDSVKPLIDADVAAAVLKQVANESGEKIAIKCIEWADSENKNSIVDMCDCNQLYIPDNKDDAPITDITTITFEVLNQKHVTASVLT